MKFFTRASALLLAVIALTGCDSTDKLTPLTGERISVLQLQKDLTPNPALQKETITLPDPWSNPAWPQAGGYPNHVPGHLSLAVNFKKVWGESVGKGGDSRTPLIAQPVVADGEVFTLDADGNVTAFDLASGRQKWHQSARQRDDEDSGAIGGGVAYASGMLYVASGYKYLVAINSASGKMVWKAPLSSPARAAPTVLEDKVYLTTLDNHLLVFNAVDGTPLWNYAGVSETTNLLGSASPAADASLVVLPLSSGEIIGLRPENGQIVWEDNLSAIRKTGVLSSIPDIRALPVIDRGVVYAVSYSGRMVALDQISGERLWQRELGSAETPWVAGDVIFVVTSEQQLAALSRKTGDIYWVTPLPRYNDKDRNDPVVWAGPLLAGGQLIVVSSGGEMDVVNPQDGKVMKTEKLDSGAMISPVVAGNTLLVLTQNGELTAYR